MINETTKPNGSGNCWLEIGTYTTDEFGDQVWKPAKPRYPHQDSDLKVKREFEGRGASQRIHWKIIVPAGYPRQIAKRWGSGDIQILQEGE